MSAEMATERRRRPWEQSPHPNIGCIDGFLPVSPIDRRPSVSPCPKCVAADEAYWQRIAAEQAEAPA